VGQVAVMFVEEVPLAGVVVLVTVFGLFTVLAMDGEGNVVACALKKEEDEVTPCKLVSAPVMLAALNPEREESCDAV